MTQEQFEREKNYRVSVAIAKTMLSNRLISEHEYSKIERMLRVKYTPVFGGL
ncbi:MAG: SHOCT domain-containing protein [Bacillota bacterium]